MLKIFHFFYKMLHETKKTILVGHFGYDFQCKHNPPCSDFFVKQVGNEGWLKGSVHGLKRLLTCW